MKRSLHIGSAMIDIITLVATENIERATLSNDGKSYLMLETGRKLQAETITSHVGGGACNTAVSAARLGWEAAVLAMVGEDLNAQAIAAHLAGNNVTDRMIPCDQATGTAVMIASHDRNASIFVQRGANERLTVADLPDFAGFDLVYVSALSNASADCFPEIVARAKAAGAMVAVNPGIRQLTSRAGAFLEALAHIDLLSVNRVEAEAMVPVISTRNPGPEGAIPDDAPDLLRRGLNFAGFDIGLRQFMGEVSSIGPRWVLLTDGMEGAWLMADGTLHWHPAREAEVAGTAGAGDAFCSTLATQLAEGRTAIDALGAAALNAACVVAHVDTTTGLMTRDALAANGDALTAQARSF